MKVLTAVWLFLLAASAYALPPHGEIELTGLTSTYQGNGVYSVTVSWDTSLYDIAEYKVQAERLNQDGSVSVLHTETWTIYEVEAANCIGCSAQSQTSCPGYACTLKRTAGNLSGHCNQAAGKCDACSNAACSWQQCFLDNCAAYLPPLPCACKSTSSSTFDVVLMEAQGGPIRPGKVRLVPVVGLALDDAGNNWAIIPP